MNNPAQRHNAVVRHPAKNGKDKDVKETRVKKKDAKEKIPTAHNVDKVLLLGFQYSDIEGLDTEAEGVRLAFRSKGYDVILFKIDMVDPWPGLYQKLDDFLTQGVSGRTRIIYYHGHGGVSRAGLEFCSHNHPEDVSRLQRHACKFWRALRDPNITPEERREIADRYQCYQQIAGVDWSGIKTLIAAAECDVLTILDCCAAGAAAARTVSETAEQFGEDAHRKVEKYAKELIAATVWEGETHDEMSKALCQALNDGDGGTAISVQTLHAQMTDILAKKFYEKVEQIEDKEQELEEKEKQLKAERKQLERENREGDVKGKTVYKKVAELDKEVADLKEEKQRLKQPLHFQFHSSVNGYRERFKLQDRKKHGKRRP